MKTAARSCHELVLLKQCVEQDEGDDTANAAGIIEIAIRLRVLSQQLRLQDDNEDGTDARE